MRIGIDATCWQNTRGFGRYTRELVRHLLHEFEGAHDFVLVADHATAAAGGFPERASVVAAGGAGTPAVSPHHWRRPGTLLQLGRAAAARRPDVFWFPAVASYYPVLGTVPVVVTVHDAMTEMRPASFFPSRRARAFWRAKTWLARRQASTIVTPSEAARDAVARAWRWPIARIAVVDEAPAAVFRAWDTVLDPHPVLARYGLPTDRPLILYVGGIDPHKNLSTLLRAMAMLKERRAGTWHLALVGEYRAASPGCHQALLALRHALDLGTHVSFTGFVPDEDLSILYNAAACLVLPSLDEGFGLPVVEAMACGLPVAVSARGSLPALAGDAGLVFDPEEPGEICHAIDRLLIDDDLSTSLGVRGRSRAATFTWTRSARQLMAVLEETAAR